MEILVLGMMFAAGALAFVAFQVRAVALSTSEIARIEWAEIEAIICRIEEI